MHPVEVPYRGGKDHSDTKTQWGSKTSLCRRGNKLVYNAERGVMKRYN